MMRKNIFLLIFVYLLILHFNTNAQLGTIKKNIKVDQFGFKCSAQKIAVIANPQVGYNNPSESFSPSTSANQYQIRRWSDNTVMFTGTLVAWNSGATDYYYGGGAQARFGSGDIVWWLDFSSVVATGSYYVYDIGQNARSYQFEIRDDIYLEALKQATHSYYYQRCGVAKTSMHAGAGWADAACHDLALQDLACRSYVASGTGNSASEKDLSGGWHDAGDHNKYVNFAYRAVPELLLAYEEEPSAWGDNFNIPESGNGVPDILDEVKVELDWLLKMQAATGDNSVLSMVGVRVGTAVNSPPSSDLGQRFYGPATTSATLSAAAMFALGAIQFNAIGNIAYATTLRTAAENAWTWAGANPSVTWTNTGKLSAGEQEINATQLAERKLSAASFLYVLTGTAAYKTYFDANYNTINNWYIWNAPNPNDGQIQDAMLYYTKAAGATASVKTNILTKYTLVKTHSEQYPRFTSATTSDPYRSYLKDWFWGSNEFKSRQANMYMAMIEYNLDAATHSGYKNCATGYIHYLHGVNPTSFCYLSNMVNYGAENSIQEFYNAWFVDGNASWDRVGTSTYGPPPGFVPCGPNPYYSTNTTLLPPYNQPVSKSYRDWNTSSDASWEVTENALYNNGPYVRLLSKFVDGNCGNVSAPVSFSHLDVRPNSNNSVFVLWGTYYEKNNNHFIIENSPDGINFTPIGMVKGSYTTQNEIKKYEYEDNNPYYGISYYRIKQIDTDGNFTYSTIKDIHLGHNSESKYDWVLFPNPAHDNLLLNNNGVLDSEYSISIMDNLGRSIIQIENKDERFLKIDISALSEGIYNISIKSTRTNTIIKFVKK